MKLVSLNVGIKIDNTKDVIEFVNKQNPDIIALQELMRPLEDSVFEIFRSESVIKSSTQNKLPHSFFGPLYATRKFTMNGNPHRDFGGLVEQGNTIISKYPILRASNEFFYQSYSLDTDRTSFVTEDHSRAIQMIEMQINDKNIQILNLHGVYSKDKKDSERSFDQSKQILKMAKRKNIPTIIVGDFNLLPSTKSIEMIDKEFRNLIKEYNIKSTRPDFRDHLDEGNIAIDYVFVSKGIKVNDFKVIDTDISDHLPLVLDFDLE